MYPATVAAGRGPSAARTIGFTQVAARASSSRFPAPSCPLPRSCCAAGLHFVPGSSKSHVSQQCRAKRRHLVSNTHCRQTAAAAATGTAATDMEAVVPPDTNALRDLGAAVLQDVIAQQEEDKSFDWADHWYPLAFTCDLDLSKPHRFMLLNKPLVVWWQPTEQRFHVFQDVCPHRLVPLSEGRINLQGELECGYHGWSFNGCGSCTRIPQGGNNEAKRASVPVYPSVVKQGLLFVKPVPLPRGSPMQDTDVDTSDVPIVAELEDPEWVTTDTWRDIPYDATTLLENVIDSSHVSFTHHSTMSDRNQVGAYDLTVTEKLSRSGFKGTWGTGPRAGAYGPQVTWFRPPCYMQHKLDSSEKRGVESMVVVYAIPTTPGNCRLLNRNVFRFTKSKFPALVFRHFPKFVQHISPQTLLEDDQIFLQLGEREYNQLRAAGKSHAQAMFNASPADTFVNQFRAWLDQHGGGGPFGPINEAYLRRLGPVYTLEQHLDRYSQHTRNCATCLAALKNIKRLRVGVSAIVYFSGVAALLSLALAVSAASFPGKVLAPVAESLVTASSVAGSLLPTSQSTLGSVLSGLGTGLLTFVNWVCGTGSVVERLVRAGVWAGVCVAAALLSSFLEDWEGKFYRGVYPPPRNVAKD